MIRDVKQLSFIDAEKNKLMQFSCKLRDDITEMDVNSFYNFLYTMKLDSNLSSMKFLKEDKLTVDLVSEFHKILNSNILDFGGVLSVFKSQDLIETEIVKETVRRFIGLFDIIKEDEKPINDLEVSEIVMRHPNFIGKPEREMATKEVNSINANTLLFKNNSSEELIKLSSLKENVVMVKQLSAKRAVG